MKLALQERPSRCRQVTLESAVGSCSGASGKMFEADFASSCPYVLSVGSTEWNRFNASKPPIPGEKLHEVATQRFPSGGGFSNVFGIPRIPSYQSDAVSAYFDQVESRLGFDGYHHFVENSNFSSVTGGVYHYGGRAYPDVGAVGDRQVVYSGGAWWLVGGTSLSSPVWGSVLTLVNEARIAADKRSMGFIHPVLVSIFACFSEDLLTVKTAVSAPRSLQRRPQWKSLGVAQLASLLPKDGFQSRDLGK